MIEFDAVTLATIFVALALGGTLKGATGMGAPLIAIPVMASFFDVRLAVVLMALPNLLTNLWQLWLYRAEGRSAFAWRLALSGAAGAAVGTALLATAPTRLLSLIIAVAVLGYVVLRVWRSDLRLSAQQAMGWVIPVGVLSGVLQGAAGISAPVSVSFLNAARLERRQFVACISLFFAAIGVVQISAMAALGLYTGQTVLLSLVAMAPLFAFMPLGARLARSITPKAFDRLVLGVLIALAVKLIIWP